MRTHNHDISTTMEWSRRKFFQAVALLTAGFVARTDSFDSVLVRAALRNQHRYGVLGVSSTELKSVGGVETISLGYLERSDEIAFVGDVRALQGQVEELAAQQYSDVNREAVARERVRHTEGTPPLSTAWPMPRKRQPSIIRGPELPANLIPAEKIDGDPKLVGEKIHVTLVNLFTSPNNWKKRQQGILAYKASWPTPIQTDCDEVKDLTYVQAFRVNKRDNRSTTVTNHQILRHVPVQDVLNFNLSLVKVLRRHSKTIFKATLEFLLNHELFVNGLSPFVPYANAASQILAYVMERFASDPRIWDEQVLSLNPIASKASSEYKLRTGTYLAVGGMFDFQHHSYTGLREPGPLATFDERGNPVKVNRNCVVFHISRV